jgi:cell wall-associated NlpC family hydrolase
VIRAAAHVALWTALAGCAATSLQRQPTPASSSAIAGSATEQSPARSSAGPRAIMVELATSMLGQPYRFGGAAPGGFDCSGLVAYAANGAGVRVPRTAHQQLHAGTPVARSELKAGDLVFMHLAHKELHVGIAIGGERFIHAPSAGGRVRIDSLAAPPYSSGFLGARRVIAVQ